jgi:hypothetical protein
MNDIRAVTVCVNYARELAVTMPTVLPHVERWCIVTAPHDTDTIQLARREPKVTTIITSCFWDDGAFFNKGKAVSRGLEQIGRKGWLLALDADIVLPERMDLSQLEEGRLYSPYRRMWPEWGPAVPPESEWPRLPEGPERRNGEWAGYFQLWHSWDRAYETTSCYPTHWHTAGGCDSDFWKQWPGCYRERLPFDVLHLGRHGQNWKGRSDA